MEPHKGPGQGQDFSFLSALALQYPSALTLRDIGITERTRPATTTALLHDLPTCPHTEGSSGDTARVSDPDQVLPAVLGHYKWKDDVLICERLLRADSAPSVLPCLSPSPYISFLSDGAGARGLITETNPLGEFVLVSLRYM